MTDSKWSRLGDTAFALFHLALIAVIAVYAVVSLVQGNTWRFLVILCGLAIYYFLVLDKPVRAEIERRRRLRGQPPSRRSDP
ncbi:MAG: hypothetical protein ABSA30_07295 [Candidatus Aminicenantales bacterium]|jgi:hypothetical protein